MPEAPLELDGLEMTATNGVKVDLWWKPVRPGHSQLDSSETGMWVPGVEDFAADSVSVFVDKTAPLAGNAFNMVATAGTLLQPGADNVDLEKSWHEMPSIEAGVFTPAPGSALTDMGTPGSEPGQDADNRRRPVDGDNDGVARRDIGAFEAPAGTSVEPAK